MKSFERIGSVFDAIAQRKKRPAVAPPSVLTEFSEIPALPPYSDCPKIHLLVDENVGGWQLSVLEDRDFLTSYVKRFMAATPDENVFSYAVEHQRAIITSDAGFADFARHDHTRSHGTLIIPNGTKGGENKKERTKAAILHFRDTFAAYMTSRRGVVAQYDSMGKYKVLIPSPHQPSMPHVVAKGQYING